MRRRVNNHGRRPRTYDPGKTRSELLSAAIELFGAKGFHATSVQELVDTARVTKGAFYHHFPSKQAMLHVIHDEFIDSYLGRQQRIVERFESAHERLFHQIRLLVFIITEYHAQVEVFFQERRELAGDKFPELYDKREAAARSYTDTIALGIDNGEFRPNIDPELDALAVLGMCNWIYQWYRPSGARAPDEIGQAFAVIALRGLTARPQRLKSLLARPIPQPDPAREREHA